MAVGAVAAGAAAAGFAWATPKRPAPAAAIEVNSDLTADLRDVWSLTFTIFSIRSG